MKVRILGSSPGVDGHPSKYQYAHTYLVNGRLAVDAGCLGWHGAPADQNSIKSVMLTHSHIDHVASLPLFLENVFNPPESCPRIYGSQALLDALQTHMFNEIIWPDFFHLLADGHPFCRTQVLEAEKTVTIEGLRITPVEVDHPVPTQAYFVDDGRDCVLFAADSGPTERVWEIARATPNLRAVFIEASFPNSLQGLADASLHLTPRTFAAEAAKLPMGLRIIAVHLKPRYRREVVDELEACGIEGLEIGQSGKLYEFGE